MNPSWIDSFTLEPDPKLAGNKLDIVSKIAQRIGISERTQLKPAIIIWRA